MDGVGPASGLQCEPGQVHLRERFHRGWMALLLL